MTMREQALGALGFSGRAQEFLLRIGLAAKAASGRGDIALMCLLGAGLTVIGRMSVKGGDA